MRSSLLALTLLIHAPLAAWAQGAPTPEDLVTRCQSFRARDRALRLDRIQVQALRDRVLDAEEALEVLRRRSAGEPEGREDRARQRLLAGRFERAQRDYLALSEGEAAESRATRRERLAAEFGALLQDLEQVLAAHEDVGLRLLRGELYADKGRYDLARGDAEAVILERPTDPRALLLLGSCLVPENRWEEALGLFEQAHSSQPSDLTRCQRAIALYCLNRFDEALAAREVIADVSALPPELQQRCAWWLAPARLRALAEAWRREQIQRTRESEQGDLPRVELRTKRGSILLELFEQAAPNTTASFLRLVEAGFYDGLAWHRVVPNLMAQTGDPASREGAAPDGPRGNPGYRLPDEDSGRTHFRGSLSLARARGGQDSGGSQVFLSLIPAPRLDDRHAVFGRVVSGLRVLDRLRQGDRIEAARVVRKRDHDYPLKTLPLQQGPPAQERDR